MQTVIVSSQLRSDIYICEYYTAKYNQRLKQTLKMNNNRYMLVKKLNTAQY